MQVITMFYTCWDTAVDVGCCCQYNNRQLSPPTSFELPDAGAEELRTAKAHGMQGNAVFCEMENSVISVKRSEWKFTLLPSLHNMQSCVCLAECFDGSQPFC